MIDYIQLPDEDRRVLRRQFRAIVDPQIDSPTSNAISLRMFLGSPADDTIACADYLWTED